MKLKICYEIFPSQTAGEQRSCDFIPGFANTKFHCTCQYLSLPLLNCVVLSKCAHCLSVWALAGFSPSCLIAVSEARFHEMISYIVDFGIQLVPYSELVCFFDGVYTFPSLQTNRI